MMTRAEKISTKIDRETVFNECVNYFELRDKKRDRFRSYRRFYLYKKMKESFFSLIDIGKLLNRDHSSVIYGLKQHEKFKKDKEYLHTNEEVKQWLEQRGIN